jgi:glucose/mannose transport system substrate-binding protein
MRVVQAVKLVAGVSAVALLAACGSSKTASSAPTSSAPSSSSSASSAPAPVSSASAAPVSSAPSSAAASSGPAVSAAPATKSLEVFSWWTSGSESAALNTLYTNYTKAYPAVKIVNGAVAGGGGANAQAVLQSRLQGGNPPDSWQTHPGAIIQQYVAAGVVQPLTSLFQSENWSGIVPKVILDNTTVDGQIYSVETGVHRGNELWYNKSLLAAHGVTLTADTTMAQWLTDVSKLKAAGVTPVCLGDGSGGFGDQMLLEGVLISELGPDAWNGLFTGQTKWSDPKVAAALQDYATLYAASNTDHSALTWDQAVKDLVDNKCAFNVMGDWAYGELKKDGAKEGTDFGYMPVPGSPSTFDMVIDSFVVAKATKNTTNAMDWAKTIMSTQGQIDFNTQKGAIPVLTNVPMTSFPPYQQQSATDFRNSSEHLVWSFANGEVGSPAYVQAYDNAINTFNGNKKASAFATAMDSAATS